MISVLIPVYNFDIRLLINDLYQQLTSSAVPFEIICYDDSSQLNYKEINRQIITQYPDSLLLYHELPKNIGRARIRNALAKAAKHPYLLFMDCDSKVISPSYISCYLSHLQPDTLLYGGRSYAPTPPGDALLHFHWQYGTQREQVPASIRQQNPYHAFMTNNFLIPKNIFTKIQFDERLTQYGHEDTLFGMMLKNQQIKILHLNNPLEHIGLETFNVFLQKTRQGIQNLALLMQGDVALETKLSTTYGQLKKIRAIHIVYFLLKTLHPFMIKQFNTPKPDLLWFDLYKLYLLMKAFKELPHQPLSKPSSNAFL